MAMERGNEVSLRRANPAVLRSREMQGWTVQSWQERAWLPAVSRQPWRACGAGEADLQEGQDAFENVLGCGHPMIQEHSENHWSVLRLHHARDDRRMWEKHCLHLLDRDGTGLASLQLLERKR